ncbi:hypothetical protein IWX46DRAFT_615716 [Phyllosticta citricarpa]|uniref:Uncharacterized protein n=1 Tax=Phyllosticta citricarpa TaxID=55181 RepID=A0ABR1L8X3_9PEZI
MSRRDSCLRWVSLSPLLVPWHLDWTMARFPESPSSQTASKEAFCPPDFCPRTGLQLRRMWRVLILWQVQMG